LCQSIWSNVLTVELMPVNFVGEASNHLNSFGASCHDCFYFCGQTPSSSETGIEGVVTISPAQPGPTRADAPRSLPLGNVAFVVETETARWPHLPLMTRVVFGFPCRPVTTKSQSGEKTRDRSLWPLRGRCCAGQNDKGPVGLRLGHSIVAEP